MGSGGSMAETFGVGRAMNYVVKEENELIIVDDSPPSSPEYEKPTVLLNERDPLYIGEDTNVPSATCRLPSKDDYEGVFKFCVELDTTSTERNKWSYSQSLNKIFISMHNKLPVKFKWNCLEPGLYVRALLVYLDENFYEVPVIRCIGHQSVIESNEGVLHLDHVIRCDHKKSMYEQDEESQRRSVRVPLDLPQPGTEWTTVIYTFVCKNSCTQGMNRRPTGIIFTLENKDGMVLGRKMMKLRICSCPRRDILKEEEDAQEKDNDKPQGKGRWKQHRVPGKRIAQPEHSQEIVNFQIKLPRLYVQNVARHIVNTILLMEVERGLSEGEVDAVRDCEKYLQ